MAIYKKTIFTTMSCLFIIISCDIYAEGFEDYKTEFSTYKQQELNEFDIYKKQLLRAFNEYRVKTAKIWGDKDNPISDNKKWVSYQGDLNHRSVVDFEKGIVEVEIAIPANDSINEDRVLEDLKKTVINAMTQGVDDRSIIEIAKQPVAIASGAPVLSNQVADSHGVIVTESDFEVLAKKIVEKPKKKRIKGTDGKLRTIYIAQFKLVPDHIRRRALKYKTEVDNNAKKQKIPSAVIFSIMEVESMFNPMARSHSPAFGLMQLVPTTGARDAYRYLYKKDRVVSDQYLYKPDNNIRLGSAYLNRLYYSYFKDVKNEESRQWASVAAYNTGMGNVYAAFAGRYSKSRFGSGRKWKQVAFNEINKRSPEEVYQFLHSNLSSEEGRHYVKKVRQRIVNYK